MGSTSLSDCEQLFHTHDTHRPQILALGGPHSIFRGGGLEFLSRTNYLFQPENVYFKKNPATPPPPWRLNGGPLNMSHTTSENQH